jgi:hypothetical protein
MAWMPNELAPYAGDPVYPQWEKTFDLWQEYELTRDGNWQPSIWIRGEMALNQFVTNAQPRITEIEFGPGGSINGPSTVYVAVTQGNANDEQSAVSNMAAVFIPAGVSNQQVTIGVAPGVDPTLVNYTVWAGFDRRRIGRQFKVGSPMPTGNVIVYGPIEDMTQGLPDGAARRVGVMAKHVWHAGVAGLEVNSVTSPNQIQCNDFIGSTDNWIGQKIFICSNKEGEVPLWNFAITAFDKNSGTLTVTPNCVRASPAESVQAGDVLIVYSFPTAATANTITNTLWANSVNMQQFGSPGLGLPGERGPDDLGEVGRVVHILRGTGAGQQRVVTNNDRVTMTVSPPWTVVPDSSSAFIVADPAWPYNAMTSELYASHPGVVAQLHAVVPNLADEVALVGGYLIDAEGRWTADSQACYRMIYVFGQPPTVRVVGPGPGPWQIEATDRTIRIDTSQNEVTVKLPPLVAYQGRDTLIHNDGSFDATVETTGNDVFADGSAAQIISAGLNMRITAGGIPA